VAKLILSEAARACNVARTTIQRAVKTGRLSLDVEHRVDMAELLRIGYQLNAAALHAASQQPAADMQQDAAPQHPRSSRLQQPRNSSYYARNGMPYSESEKPGQGIRCLCAELTGSYPVGTSSKSHNCCPGKGKRTWRPHGLGRYSTKVSAGVNGKSEVCGEAKRVE
jgi:hypothetical protein